MRRIVGIIVHNWPLKLAAIGLATLMYGGLALSQNTQTFAGVVPVRYVNEPNDTVVLPSTPRPVTEVRYFAPTGVQVATTSFIATVDLSGQEGKVGVVSVPINLTTPDSRIRVLGFVPDTATVELDHLTSRDVRVEVVHGAVPDGLTVGPTTVQPATVTVTGAATIVSKVDAVRADVTIQSSGIDVDEEAQLVAVDKLGNAVSPVDVSPPTARVVIPVFSDRQSRTLPVNPIITGRPAAGFEIESVAVDPLVALVTGDADQLAELSQVDTVPIPMTGVSADETVKVGLALPTGVVAVNDAPVTVTITIRPVTGTRTFSAGLQLIGESADLRYALSTDRVLITIGGSIADLDRLSGATLVATLDVAGLKEGAHDVVVTANLPTGTALVAADP
ncbi:MAG: YbbR-like domain-containing protein, partial [Chloroflexota bacterium]